MITPITSLINFFGLADYTALQISGVFISTLLSLVLILAVTCLLPTYFVRQKTLATIAEDIKENRTSAASLTSRFYLALLTGIMVVSIGVFAVTEWQLMDLLVEKTDFALPGESTKFKVIVELTLFVIALYFYGINKKLNNFAILQAVLLIFTNCLVFLALSKGYLFNFMDQVCFNLLASIFAGLIARFKFLQHSVSQATFGIKAVKVTLQGYLVWYYLFLVVSKMLFWFYLYNHCFFAPLQGRTPGLFSLLELNLNVENFYVLLFMLAVCWLCVALRFLYIAYSYVATATSVLIVPVPSEFFILYLWQVKPLILVLTGTFQVNKVKNPKPGFKSWLRNVSLTLLDPVGVLLEPGNLGSVYSSIVIASSKESTLKLFGITLSAVGGGGFLVLYQHVAQGLAVKQELDDLTQIQEPLNRALEEHWDNPVLKEHLRVFNLGVEDAHAFKTLDQRTATQAVGSGKSAAFAICREMGHPVPVRTTKDLLNLSWTQFQKQK